jgi:hypothetical protein
MLCFYLWEGANHMHVEVIRLGQFNVRVFMKGGMHGR